MKVLYFIVIFTKGVESSVNKEILCITGEIYIKAYLNIAVAYVRGELVQEYLQGRNGFVSFGA